MITRRGILLSSVGAAAAAGIGLPRAAFAQDRAIAGIVFQQDQYMRTVLMGMKAAAEASGVELLEANSDNKLEKESQLIDTYIARGVQAICFTPLSADGSIPAVQKAVDAGITVITFGTTVNSDLPKASITSSNIDLGNATGDAASAFLKTLAPDRKVKIATVAFKSLLPEQSDDRVNGFLDKVKDQVEVVAQQDAWLAEKAVAVASDILTANPDIEIIYAANEGGTVGAAQAVKKAGLEGKVFVFGIDGTEQLANMLLDPDNVLQAVTAQQPFEVGRLALEAANAVLDGKTVEANQSVPVLPLTRTNPDGVNAFLEQLKALG
ncbi:MAG TPA: substrate-binding domain-containing protein [Tabrizicola sp.]|nr:substrate-binding domain-containing protein [Tabrizicola sp.]